MIVVTSVRRFSQFKGPGTYLLEPVAKGNCENSKLAYDSSIQIYIYAQVLHIVKHAFCIILKK